MENVSGTRVPQEQGRLGTTTASLAKVATLGTGRCTASFSGQHSCGGENNMLFICTRFSCLSSERLVRGWMRGISAAFSQGRKRRVFLSALLNRLMR